MTALLSNGQTIMFYSCDLFIIISFTARRSYAGAVLGVVILSVRLSV